MVRLFVGAFCVSMLVATVVSSAPPEAANSQDAVAPADKVRCKRYTETGTIAKVHKECHTQAEWQQMAGQGRQQARDMMNRNLSGQQSPH